MTTSDAKPAVLPAGVYRRELLPLQRELVKLQEWVRHENIKMCVLFEGRDLHTLAPEALRHARRDFQMVFQDPFSSLDPRMIIARTVAEPLEKLDHVSRAERRERAAAMLDAAADAFAALRDRLGPYPYPTFKVVQSAGGYGMESPRPTWTPPSHAPRRPE